MTTTIALYHRHYFQDHLDKVTAEMQQLGAPAIRCIWSDMYGMWMAVEGCHRLRAAHSLDILPTIIDISNDATVTMEIDCEDVEVDVAELTEELQDDLHRTDYLRWED